MKHKLLLALLLAASALGCQNKKVVTSPDPAFAQYIKAYTGGIVAPGTALRVELNEPVPEDRQITEGLFSFSPQLRGTVVWNTPTQVSFHPDENAMESGKTYAACFQLGKVTDVVQPNLREFRYGFAVRGEAGAYVADDEIYEGDGFHIRSATLAADGERIDLVFSAAPANAATHGLIELRGVRRSYIQVTDTLVRVYFDGRSAEDMVLTVDKAVKDNDGNALGSTFTKTFRPDEPKPAVQISIGGGILPDKERLLLPFRAVNLSAVEVRIVKIYENNVLSYLQDNDLGEEGSLRRSGRLIYRGDIPLDASLDLHKWNDHVIDLSGLLKKEPGAIYRIRLNFRLDQSLYGGKSPMMRPGTPSGTPTAEDDAAWDVTSPYYWDNDFDWENYDWRESEDPEKPSYYMDSDRFPSIMLMTSEIGLVTEYAGGDKVWVAATDLLDASPLPGAKLEVYDYQLQKIAEGRTDRQGLAELSVSHKPFVVVARSGNSVSYLKMTSAGERSMSRFDVGGEVLSGGLKAFIYGERGVWRPGDTIHLSAIVARAGAPLPDAHPATLELYTPSGQFYRRLVGTATDGFYSFDIQTSENDPTGYWNAYFKLGGSSFHKTLNIETVKPNRFRIETSIGSATLQAGEQMNVQTSASWLAGGPASNSAVRATMTLRPVSNPFPGFDKYSFSDPSSNFTSTEMNLYSGKLDGNGFANLRITLPEASDAPGMLNAFVVTSVQEPGGDESFTTQSVLFSPYSSYVGIKVPDGDYLETDTDQIVSLAVLDADGHRVHGHKIEYAVFKTGWNWWWDNPGGSLSAYISGSSVELVGEGELTSGSNSDASFSIRVNYPDWGRYLILARDKSSGHTSGRMVTIDWPLYRGRASRRDPESLTMLSFSTSKTSESRPRCTFPRRQAATPSCRWRIPPA